MFMRMGFISIPKGFAHVPTIYRILKITGTEEILIFQRSFHINVPSALVRVHLYEYVGLFCNLRIQCIWKRCSWRFLFLPSHCCSSSDKCWGSWWRRTVLTAQNMFQSMNYNKRLKAGCCSVYFSDFKALGIMYNHWYTCNGACGWGSISQFNLWLWFSDWDLPQDSGKVARKMWWQAPWLQFTVLWGVQSHIVNWGAAKQKCVKSTE